MRCVMYTVCGHIYYIIYAGYATVAMLAMLAMLAKWECTLGSWEFLGGGVSRIILKNGAPHPHVLHVCTTQ